MTNIDHYSVQSRLSFETHILENQNLKFLSISFKEILRISESFNHSILNKFLGILAL